MRIGSNLEANPLGQVLLRLFLVQLVCLMLGALVLGLLGMGDRIAAFGYGLVLMSANAAVLAWSVGRAAYRQQREGRGLMYGGAVARFAALFGMLVLANALGMHLLFVALGMLTAQLAVYGIGVRAAMAGIRKESGV